jgi:hypothetical protein
MPDRVRPVDISECRNSPPKYPVASRLLAILDHIPAYAFDGPSRLARDAGVGRSSVWRLIHADLHQSSYRILWAVTAVLEKHLGQQIDPRDVISLDGSFPTRTVCELTGCRGCLPSHFFAESGELLPEFRHVAPGTWSERVAYLPRRKAV